MVDHSMHNMGGMETTTAPPSGMTMDPHAGHDMGMMMETETGGGGGMHNMNMDMMKMYFHTGVQETVLFFQWKITTVGGMVGSCVGIFFMALLYEGLKVLRQHLLRKYNKCSQRYGNYALSNGQSSQESTNVMLDSTILKWGRQRFCSWPHFLQTFLHMVQVFVSYMLMLIFMTYNIWLCLAVVLGAGCGYLIFGWHRSIVVDVNEHCH